jgi:hypothetical protein
MAFEAIEKDPRLPPRRGHPKAEARQLRVDIEILVLTTGVRRDRLDRAVGELDMASECEWRSWDSGSA